MFGETPLTKTHTHTQRERKRERESTGSHSPILPPSSIGTYLQEVTLPCPTAEAGTIPVLLLELCQ
jgi:hypothetical protein